MRGKPDVPGGRDAPPGGVETQALLISLAMFQVLEFNQPVDRSQQVRSAAPIPVVRRTAIKPRSTPIPVYKIDDPPAPPAAAA